MSDLNLLTSPIKRIILQSCLILSFIIINDLSIKTLSLEILDELLNYKFFNIFFLLVCLLVLINGFNFLDGINTLVISNFIICLFCIYYISNKYQLSLDFIFVQNLLIILSVIFIFNFFGKSFLGDSGTYTIGFIIGIIFVNFAYENFFRMSPYFIACILWYPAIENLFSILRRIFFKKKISKADNNHLHHLIYLCIKKSNLTKNNLFLNTLTGIMINIYLFISSLVATFYYDNTKTLLIIILFNILLYLGLYNYLFKLIKNK
jgi:UDP-N-acetylmuramyl pentapeptide phosphotransferase/UDP-N-acetylglucosamine-1-phosphate transferase